jgi:hypothetical protein
MYFASNRPGGFGGNDIYVSRRHKKDDDFGWEAPQNLGPAVNSSANESSPAISEDDGTGVRTLYFDSNRDAGFGFGPYTDDIVHNGNDIYESFLLPNDTFVTAELVTELSTQFFDRSPSIRRDGLEIFFASNRTGTFGALDLWVSTRASVFDSWSTPVNVGPPPNSTANDAGPALSFDGETLYFNSVNVPNTAGNPFNLFVTTRSKITGQK